MTYILFELPGTINRDPQEKHVELPGINWEFGAMMAEARKLLPDTRYRLSEIWERP